MASVQAPTTVATDGPGTGPGSIKSALFGLFLLSLYLALFTLGSQVPSSAFKEFRSPYEFMMFVLTLRESSILLLGIVASCLGTWRKRNQDATEANRVAWYLAYTSAGIGGAVMSGIAVGLPSIFGQMTSLFDLSRSGSDGRGQQNYTTLAFLGSFLAFLSGYDKTYFDRVIAYVAKRIGLGPA